MNGRIPRNTECRRPVRPAATRESERSGRIRRKFRAGRNGAEGPVGNNLLPAPALSSAGCKLRSERQPHRMKIRQSGSPAARMQCDTLHRFRTYGTKRPKLPGVPFMEKSVTYPRVVRLRQSFTIFVPDVPPTAAHRTHVRQTIGYAPSRHPTTSQYHVVSYSHHAFRCGGLPFMRASGDR